MSTELATQDKSNLPAGTTTKLDYATTPLGILPKTVDEALTLAKAFAASGYFSDVRDASQAVAKIMAGSEMGMPPFASMQGLYMVENRLMMGGTFVAAVIKKTGKYRYKVLESTSKSCTVEFFERIDKQWESLGTHSWTMDDAKRAGLEGKKNWLKHPQDMLFNRVMTGGAKRFTPDAFAGVPVYSEDEIEEIRGDTPKEEPMRDPVVSQSERLRQKLAGPVTVDEPGAMGSGISDPISNKDEPYDPKSEFDPEADEPIESSDPPKEAPKESAKTAVQPSDLKPTQQETLQIHDRLAAIDGAPSVVKFIKECKEMGLTMDGVFARLGEMEKPEGLGL